MSDEELQPVWLFRFALESETGVPISQSVAEELLDLIVRWAEENECQVGGGYRPPRLEER